MSQCDIIAMFLGGIYMKNKMALWKKITLGTIGGLLGLILLIVIIIFGVWNNEIRSVASIHQIVDKNEENQSAPVYQMEVAGNYYFDDFIKQKGVSNDQELIDFIVGKITKGLIPITLNAPEIGCSSFTAQDSDGNRLFGRNYDFTTTTGMIVHTKPGNGRYESYSSVDLQFLGITNGAYLNSLMQKIICLAAPYVPLDGMNEKGLACGIYMSYQGNDKATPTDQQTDRPDITSTTMLRMILDYAATVEEAVELIQAYDLHDSASTSFHYMIADSTGKSAILEWVAGTQKTDNDGSKRELKVHYNDSDSSLGSKEAANDFQYITNFIVTPNYYEESDNKAGLDRYDAVENSINPTGTNTTGIITKDHALDILKLVGRRSWDAKAGISDSNGITVWSVLYDLTNKIITWVSNEEFDNSKAIFTFKL